VVRDLPALVEVAEAAKVVAAVLLIMVAMAGVWASMVSAQTAAVHQFEPVLGQGFPAALAAVVVAQHMAVALVVTDINIPHSMEFAKVVRVLFELFGALAEVFPVLMLHQLHRNFKYLRI
jgi:hypothetical protein